MKFSNIILLFLLPILVNAQSANMDVGIATDAKNQIFIYNIGGGIGYSFTDMDYLSGGIKFQGYNLISKMDRDENDDWSTATVLNFMFYTGVRYLIPVLHMNKNTGEAKTVGFVPQVRLYFNPYVPKNLKYIDDDEMEVEVKGNYSTAFSYGLGFGVYFEGEDSGNYAALMFEYNNIDGFKTLRDLRYENKSFYFPVQTQFELSLSIFVW